MQNLTLAGQPPRDWIAPSSTKLGPSVNSEITWLLHGAAQRMRSASGEQAERHGLQVRDIVLSALDKTPNLTQVELERRSGWARPR
jgi:hypothetical protein